VGRLISGWRFVAVIAAVLMVGAVPPAASVRAGVVDAGRPVVEVLTVDRRGVARGNSLTRTDGPSLSATGRFVAFEMEPTSGASLAAGQVFVRDRLTGRLTLISKSTGGARADSDAFAPSISADGRQVLFQSAADNLVRGDGNGRSDLFLHDLGTGRTTRVDVNDEGAGVRRGGGCSRLSADGTHAAFISDAVHLAPGDTANSLDVFVRDIAAGRTIRLDLTPPGYTDARVVDCPAISADGQVVVAPVRLSPSPVYPLQTIVVAVRGQAPRIVTDRGADPALSSDGSTVAYMVTNGGSGIGVAIQRIGSGRRRVIARSGFGPILGVGGLSAHGGTVTFIAEPYPEGAGLRSGLFEFNTRAGTMRLVAPYTHLGPVVFGGAMAAGGRLVGFLSSDNLTADAGLPGLQKAYVSIEAPGRIDDQGGPVVSHPPIPFPVTTRRIHTAVARAAAVPVEVTWYASALSGVCAYQLERRVNGGEWRSVALARRRARHAVQQLGPGIFQYRVRAVSCRGGVSSWRAGPAFEPVAPPYTITEIPLVPTGLNDNGEVSGYLGSVPHAAVWSGGAVHMLADAGQESVAYAISNAGEAVGSVGSNHTAEWPAGQSPTLGGTGELFAVNSVGVAVGLDGNAGFLLDASGNRTELPLEPIAINDAGLIVGLTSTKGVPAAAAYSNGQLDLLAVPGSLPGMARAVNQAGDILVSTSYSSECPLVWHDGTFDALPSPVATIQCVGMGMNDQGQEVGWTVPGGAALWDSTGAHLLNDMVAPGQRWYLDQALAINQNGLILGTGTHNGRTMGFLLTPTS
jgi:WD40-like Beta Propeller Repeat